MRTLALALLLLVPAAATGAGRDFSQDADCGGAWLLGEDDTFAGADGQANDHSSESEDLSVDFQTLPIVDTAPPLAPAGRDSMTDNGASPVVLSGGNVRYSGPSISVGGWATHDNATADSVSHMGFIAPVQNKFFLWANASCHVVLNAAVTNGPSCPTDGSWFFLFLVHGDVGNENVLLTSESTNARTLRDCGAGCAANSTQGTGIDTTVFGLFSNNVGGAYWDGNIGEFSLFDAELADADVCELCRCGVLADTRGIGRWSECNACETPARHRCRRRF